MFEAPTRRPEKLFDAPPSPKTGLTGTALGYAGTGSEIDLDENSTHTLLSPVSSNPVLPVRLSTTSSVLYHEASPSTGSKAYPMSLSFLHKPRRSGSQTKETLYTQENASSHLDSEPRIPSVSSSSSSSSSLYSSMAAAAALEASMSDNDEDEDNRRRPYGLVRKKSGELVKPSLRARPLSLPATPTYKQVHFGTAPDVRYFNKKDRPLAVSASNSPDLIGADGSRRSLRLLRKAFNDIDDDSDYEYDDRSESDLDSDIDLASEASSSDTLTPVKKLQGPNSTRWEIELSNFPAVNVDAKLADSGMFVFLERIFISADKTYLTGHVAVRNLAYHKWVNARYTSDDWRTVIEVSAEFVPDIPRAMRKAGFERFVFKLPLVTLFNNKKKKKAGEAPIRHTSEGIIDAESINFQAFQMCIRYNTDSREFWDNNHANNYAIKLHQIKKRGANEETPRSKADQGVSLFNNNNSTIHKSHYSASFLQRRCSDSDLGKRLYSSRDLTKRVVPDDVKTLSQRQSDRFFLEGAFAKSPDTPDALNDTKLLKTPNFDDLAYDSENHHPLLMSHIGTSKTYTPDNSDMLGLSLSTNSHPIPMGARSLNEEVSDNSSNYIASVGPKSLPPFGTPDTYSSVLKLPLDSKSYKELLENYCFFNGPSTVSTFLQEK
ncbi:carbohydrate-binding module family 21 protein [Babjeviella inositovora NRRL Y-12698]|uniref:Carbohydrate-binding module family 21 protein n=1 Tax=Babjeviella inositovora NRRL Y-12698 TaxID=984486 RepID=A0A1E3QNM8_9ASCO|nr:carbohydrate-binding module family 21 protein [Babjeviella inositovora NRRL Y-12698]ODQ78587.1 carbohydrate-binding module family 21 protein [Babjeviella inositovora NRRL Y-12698]